MPGESARQRPLYPSELPLKRIAPFDGRTFDGRSDGRTAVDPSFLPSSRPSNRPSTRALNVVERSLVAWLGAVCVANIPKHKRPLPLRHELPLQTFVGGRRVVLKYGARAILDALKEMTWRSDGQRYWRPEIVSPASFLNWYLGQLAAP